MKFKKIFVYFIFVLTLLSAILTLYNFRNPKEIRRGKAATLPSGLLTRYSGNPLIKNGPENYDYSKAGPRVVIKSGSTYRIWYEAVASDGLTTVAYATSNDGLSWSKKGIQITPTQDWEKSEVSPNSILYDNGLYKLWYHAGGYLVNGVRVGGGKIGYATSPDGITWNKNPQPVLTEGTSGFFDDESVAEPRVIKTGDNYRMYYTGRNKSSGQTSLGMATSVDGINWTRYANNPIISSAEWGNFWGGAIFFDGSTWLLWHAKTPSGIYFKYSTDGIRWVNGTNNPVLTVSSDPSAPDSNFLGDSVSGYLDGNTYRIMYTGYHPNLPGWGRFEGICMASISVITSSSTPTIKPTVIPTLTSVLKQGDVNHDGKVDILDFQLLSNSFGKSSGQTGFITDADFNKDNVVNILDFQILSNNFGK